MKNRSYLLLFIFSIPSFILAQQLPNAGFENWANPKTPDNWFSGSSASILANQCKQNLSDKASGNASAEIRTEQISIGINSYDFISLGSGSLSLGKGFTFQPAAFAYKPDTFLFFYKYTATGVDTAWVKIKFTKAGNVLLEEEKSLMVNNNWEQVAMPLTGLYKSGETPDSVLVQFYSSKPRPGFLGTAGSVLKVDEVKMGYKNGSAEIAAVETPMWRVFPNPSDQLFAVETPKIEPGMVVTVYSAQGIEVLSQNLNEVRNTFYTQNWSAGFYYYTIKTNNTLQLKGILSVNH